MELTKLKTYIETISQVPAMEWAHFITLLRIKQLKKDEILFSQNQSYNHVAFVLSGVIATYYSDAKGKVAYKDFVTDGRPVSSYSALLLDQNCFFSAIALKKTWVVTVDFSSLKALFERHPCWEKLGRKAIEKVYIERERREFEFLMLDSLQRYQAFCKSFDHIKELIPQWMIASYIGINPISLSRLLNTKDMPEPAENPFE